jgi:Peptidase M16 inactive domain
LAVAAPAQAPAATDAIKRLTTPDGSRFVLIADASIPHVHWAIATWTDGSCDPTQLPGLSRAVHQVSLNGTFRTGSIDPAAERAALQALDDAWLQKLQKPADDDAARLVLRCDEAAQRLADLRVFPRVLAALPVHRPELLDRGPGAALVLTTLPAAIADVGTLLVERREDQALRGLPRIWMNQLLAGMQLHAGRPFAAIDTELLALLLPNHPYARLLEAPPFQASERLGAWQRTQRPERTVHVLLGDFDTEAASRVLMATFVTTSLPPWQPPPEPVLRPLTGTRRSQVTGLSTPMVSMAWVLPPIGDPYVLETAVRWLADGAESRIGLELQRRGRTGAKVGCRAPWPPLVDGKSLFKIEISDPAGVDGALDLVLAVAREAIATPPTAAQLRPATAALQHEWRERTSDPRQLAVEIAINTLLWPSMPPTPSWPERVEPAALQELLRRVFAGQAAIVEGRR